MLYYGPVPATTTITTTYKQHKNKALTTCALLSRSQVKYRKNPTSSSPAEALLRDPYSRRTAFLRSPSLPGTYKNTQKTRHTHTTINKNPINTHTNTQDNGLRGGDTDTTLKEKNTNKHTRWRSTWWRCRYKAR